MSEIVGVTQPQEGVVLVEMDLSASDGFVSWAAAAALADALARARGDGARVAVLASTTPGTWYEHAWLTDLRRGVAGEPTSGPAEGWFRALAEIRSPELVTIAAISGDCSGGGAELGWTCDLRVAEEQAMFRQPEVFLGLATGIGGTSRLARLIGRTATAEMVLDGGPMPARRIYELGGINRVVPEGDAVKASLAWAARLAARPPGALAALKKILNDSEERHLGDALENEQQIFLSTAVSAEASGAMGRAHERFAAGEKVGDVYRDD